jgi:uncharacterized membrane protein
VRALVIVSIACLAIGVSLIFAYCNGTTNFQFAYPLSGASLHVDVTTTGVPALAGIMLTFVGAVLLIVTWFVAVFRRARADVETVETPERREEPFRE